MQLPDLIHQCRIHMETACGIDNQDIGELLARLIQCSPGNGKRLLQRGAGEELRLHFSGEGF